MIVACTYAVSVGSSPGSAHAARAEASSKVRRYTTAPSARTLPRTVPRCDGLAPRKVGDSSVWTMTRRGGSIHRRDLPNSQAGEVDPQQGHGNITSCHGGDDALEEARRARGTP